MTDKPRAPDSRRVPEAADPFAAWREWVAESEHQMNRMFNEMMGTEQFARASGGWVEAMTLMQQTMNEGAQRYFEAVNLPTRTDVAELAERLTAVEERLLRIEGLLARAIGRRSDSGPGARPTRTRQSPSASKPGAAADSSAAPGGRCAASAADPKAGAPE